MLKLALKIFPRMLRDRAFTLLVAALTVACGTITAISLFVERIDNTLNDEAASFIAADAKIQGTIPPLEKWLESAEANALDTASYVHFGAMTFSDSGMVLTQVKAVDDAYPLKGELEIGLPPDSGAGDAAEGADGKRNTIQTGPKSKTAWLAPRLFSALNIEPGSKIKIGNAEFVAEFAIYKEPDNAQSFFGVEPRVMIHIDDVKSTGAVQFGSRINYALLVSGNDSDVSAFKEGVKAELGEHRLWLSPEDGSLAFNSALERAQRFLLLAGSLSVILAGVAIALAANRFALVQQAQVAILKTLGMKPVNVTRFYLFLIIGMGLLGFVLGSLAGWGLHYGILFMLGDLAPQQLASAGYQSFVFGFVTTIVSLFSFAAPPILSLRHVSPVSILRSEKTRYQTTLSSLIISVVAIAVLIYFYSLNIKVTVSVLLGLFTCVLISLVLSSILFRVVGMVQPRTHSFWRLGIANLKKQKMFTSLQIFIFASVALLLSLLFQVRTHLIGEWEPLVDTTPNHFAFNIFEDELPEIESRLREENIVATEFYPMSRGRLIDINGTPIKEKIIPNETRSDYQRELNLTWSRALGEDNEVETGSWWTESDGNTLLVSSESQYAAGLGLELGDQLRFSIAGNEIVATLSNIRSVQWDSMNPNFYMIFNQPIAEDFAANWITSFYLPPAQKDLITTLSRSFPTVSIVELDQTLDLVKSVITRLSRAIEFILVLVAIASALVLLTSVYATLDERLRESALLRSFGAKRRFVQNVLLVEFISIGLLSGLFASIAAELSLYYIQTSLLDSEYRPNVKMWVITPMLTAIIIGALGYISTLRATYVPPLYVLRENH